MTVDRERIRRLAERFHADPPSETVTREEFLARSRGPQPITAEARASGWFQLGDYTFASGRRSTFKVECDDLTDAELAAMCSVLARILRPFGEVHGVPTGGLRVADHMRPHSVPGCMPLVVDDVWTTGGSMERYWDSLGRPMALRAVLFARGPYPPGVVALWTLDPHLWEA